MTGGPRRRSSQPPTPPPVTPGAEADDTTRLIASMQATGDLLDAVLREGRLYAGAWRARKTPPSGSGQYCRVLVVDDDESMRVLYQEALRAGALQVWTAAGALESLSLACAHRPDVIVMDYAMPGADGGEAVRMLAADPRSRGIPIVMLTAYVDMIPVDTRTHCAAVVAKPCAPDELAYLLRLVAEAHSGRPSP